MPRIEFYPTGSSVNLQLSGRPLVVGRGLAADTIVSGSNTHKFQLVYRNNRGTGIINRTIIAFDFRKKTMEEDVPKERITDGRENQLKSISNGDIRIREIVLKFKDYIINRDHARVLSPAPPILTEHIGSGRILAKENHLANPAFQSEDYDARLFSRSRAVVNYGTGLTATNHGVIHDTRAQMMLTMPIKRGKPGQTEMINAIEKAINKNEIFYMGLSHFYDGEAGNFLALPMRDRAAERTNLIDFSSIDVTQNNTTDQNIQMMIDYEVIGARRALGKSSFSATNVKTTSGQGFETI
jgi:hypothetical protein